MNDTPIPILLYITYLAGIAQFGILIASASTPKALDWAKHLKTLPTLLRQMFWVYGIYIVLMIISFATITVCFPHEMMSGTPLARALAAVIAIFWGIRLIIQWFVFDAEPFLTTWFYRVGYQLLTLTFIYLTATYTWLAVS